LSGKEVEPKPTIDLFLGGLLHAIPTTITTVIVKIHGPLTMIFDG